MSESERTETSHAIAVTLSGNQGDSDGTGPPTVTVSVGNDNSSTKPERGDHSGPAPPGGWHLEGFEDKNPFSGFSEEHMSKLDEFLSSEEARKILQQTNEGDFTETMAQVAGLDSSQDSANTSDDLLALDMFDKSDERISAFSDHAYALPSYQMPKQPVIVLQTASASPSGAQSSSPRKSARIAIRKGRNADDDVEEVKDPEQTPEDVTVEDKPDEAEDKEAGGEEEDETPSRGRGRPKGRKVEQSPLNIRRSTRIGDHEQREMAEKILQENRQREKEAMEALQSGKAAEKLDDKKTPIRKGGRGRKAAVKAEEEEEEGQESEEEEKEVKKGKGRKGTNKKTKKNKEEENEEEEEEEEEGDDEKTKKTKKKAGKQGVKGKGKKGKAEDEDKSEEDEEESEEEEVKTPRGGRKKIAVKGKKGGKKQVKQEKESDSEEESSPKQRGKKNVGKKAKTEEESSNEEEEEEEETPKGKKKGVQKGKKKVGKKGQKKQESEEEEEDEDDTPKGKKKVVRKGKKTKECEEVETTPKGKKKVGKNEKEKEEDSDEEEEEDTPVRGKLKRGRKPKAKADDGIQEEKNTPMKGKKVVQKGKKVAAGKKGKKNVEESNEEDSEEEVETPKVDKRRGKKLKDNEDEIETVPKGKKKGASKAEDKKEEVIDEKEDTEIKKGKGVKKSPTTAKTGKKKEEESPATERRKSGRGVAAGKERKGKKESLGDSNEDISPPQQKKGVGKRKEDVKDTPSGGKRKRTISEKEDISSKGKGEKYLQRKRQDSVDSKMSEESAVQKVTPKPVKKKPRKSEEVVIDPTVMDLFKPDGVIHEKHDQSDSVEAKGRMHHPSQSEKSKDEECVQQEGIVSESQNLTTTDSDVKMETDTSGLEEPVQLQDEKDAGPSVESDGVSGIGENIDSAEVETGDLAVKDTANIEKVTEQEKESESDAIEHACKPQIKDTMCDSVQVETSASGSSLSKQEVTAIEVKSETPIPSLSEQKDSGGVAEPVVSTLSVVNNSNTESVDPSQTESKDVPDDKDSLVKVQEATDSQVESSDVKSVEKTQEVKQSDIPEISKKDEASVENRETKESHKVEDGQKDQPTSSGVEGRQKRERKPKKYSFPYEIPESSPRKDKKSTEDKKPKDKVKKTKKTETAGKSSQADLDNDDDNDNLSYEDDENDSDYEPPDQLYCICNQPHGNRFMICCDKCEDWFHGSCVNMTKARNKEMEQNKEEYICPVCTGEYKGPKLKHKLPGKKSSETKNNIPSMSKSKEEGVKKENTLPRIPKKAKTDESSSSKGEKSGSSKESHHSSEHRHRSSSKDEKKVGDKSHSERKSSDDRSHGRHHDRHHSSDHRRHSSDGKSGDRRSSTSGHHDDRKHKHGHHSGHKSSDSLKRDSSHLHHSGQKSSDSHKQDLSRKGSVGHSVKSPLVKSPGVKSPDVRSPDRLGSHGDIRRRLSSGGVGDKNLKNIKEKRTLQKCVGPGCKKDAVYGTVYCCTDCIIKHTDESLKIIHKDQQDQGIKLKDKSERKVYVLEKKTGRILTGQNAPTEANIKIWLESHRSFEILCPTKKTSSFYGNKEKEKQKEREKHVPEKEKLKPEETKEMKKADDGPDPVRLNVRKSLRDALTHRAGKADDMMLSNSEIKSLALSVEGELFKCFKDTNTKYKAKYRSLIFNLKDSKNQGLFRKVLSGTIKPYRLVRMTAEELASRELAMWREYETKHNLEMIEMTEKELMKEQHTIVKKTHKGEVTLEEEDLSTLDSKPEISKPKSETTPEDAPKADILSDLIVNDTTSQHKQHLFDLNCQICTGKIAPPAEQEPVSKKVKVGRRPTAEESEEGEEKTEAASSKKTVEEQKKAEQVVVEVLKAIQKAKIQTDKTPPIVDSTVTVGSPDSALQSGLEKKPKFTPSGPQLWKGFIFMQDVAKFVTTAYRVSGPEVKLDLPDTIHVCGRIAPEQVWDYLAKMKKIGTRDICILRFIPGKEEEKTSYINLYSYLNSRSRCGVVGNCAKYIKDFYLLPLASHSKIPSILKPFDGPGLEDNRPHMLLAVIVKQKTKRHGSDSSKQPYDPSDPKKSRSSHDKESRRHSLQLSSSESFTSPHTYSPSTKLKGKKPSPRLTPTSSQPGKSGTPLSATPSTTPSSIITPGSASATPGTTDSKDPIVKFYGSGELLPVEKTPEDDTPYSPGGGDDGDNDDPYDPESVSFDNMEESKPASTASSSSNSVAQMIEKIAQSDNPAEMTAIMVATLATATSLRDKQMLLLELTQKVKEQKDLLEAKRKRKEAVTAAISATPAMALSTLTSAISAITTVSKQLSSDGHKKSATAAPPSTSNVQATSSKPNVDAQTTSSTPPVDNVSTDNSTEGSKELASTTVTQPAMETGDDRTEKITSTEEVDKEPKPVPEALQSLFSSIPGNYSHVTNLKQDENDQQVKTSPTKEAAKSSSSAIVEPAKEGNSSSKEQDSAPSIISTRVKGGGEKKKRVGFDVSLLKFDYGDSDSEGEESGSKVEPKTDPVYEDDSQPDFIPGLDLDEDSMPVKEIPPLPRHSIFMPMPPAEPPEVPPDMPPDMPPPLPLEPPPPPPDHDPDDEEEENEDKKGKGKGGNQKPKPPPEIMLQATDPVGMVILQASFKKIQQALTVPAPPLPPLPGIGMPSRGPPPPIHAQIPPMTMAGPMGGPPPFSAAEMHLPPPGPGMPPPGPGMQPPGPGMPPHGPGMPPHGPGMPPHGPGMPPHGPGMPPPRHNRGRHPNLGGPPRHQDRRPIRGGPRLRGGPRGSSRRPHRGHRSKHGIPSLFDLDAAPSHDYNRRTWRDEEDYYEDSPEWSLDQDLRQAQDQDMRRMQDHDERVRPSSWTEYDRSSPPVMEDVDHRWPDQHKRQPRVPLALQEQSHLPPLPTSSDILEDSDMRKFIHPPNMEDRDYRVKSDVSSSPVTTEDQDMRLQPPNLEYSKAQSDSGPRDTDINEPKQKKARLKEDSNDSSSRSSSQSPVAPMSPLVPPQPLTSSSQSPSHAAPSGDKLEGPKTLSSLGSKPMLDQQRPGLPIRPQMEMGSPLGPSPIRGPHPPNDMGRPRHPPPRPQRNQPAPPGVDDWD